MSGPRSEPETHSGGRRRIAITRGLSPRLGECELTHLRREAIDLDLARRQHREYERRLEALGCELVALPAEPMLPDSVFVEDTAVVVDEVAIVARPGAASRRPETSSVAVALGAFLPLRHLEPPATLDGGDVVRCGRRLWVGRSTRTNRAGVEQLAAHLEPLGYTVEEAPVRGCLHLKSAVTRVAGDLLLVNPEWTEPRVFAGCDLLEIDPGEPFAANALPVGGRVLYATAFPRTQARLEAAGLTVETIDLSELAKAEGAVTCCSLVFET